MLSFLDRFQKQLDTVAEEKGIPPLAFQLMYRQRTMNPAGENYNQVLCQLVELLTNDYDKVQIELKKVMEQTKKASSLVENLSSRIRVYMNLKRVVPQNYFVLLKVYFNLTRINRKSLLLFYPLFMLQ